MISQQSRGVTNIGYTGPQANAINKFSRRPTKPRSGSIPRSSASIPGPLTLTDMAGLAIYHLFRKPLTVRVDVKIAVYLIFISAGSLFFDLVRPPPSTFFANKHNFLNQWFVKLGWGWTLWPLLAFVGLSSAVICGRRGSDMVKHLSRPVILTVVWWVGTTAFNWVENHTGVCTLPEAAAALGQVPAHHSKPACVKAGGRFNGFDISGHVFLLVLCNLVILEEVGIMRCWGRLREVLHHDPFLERRASTPALEDGNNPKEEAKKLYEQLSSYIKVITVFLSALSILWDLMLFFTVVYFHNLPSKILAAVIVVVVWAFVYRIWLPFSTKMWCGPAQPGHCGVVNFLAPHTARRTSRPTGAAGSGSSTTCRH